MNNTFLRRLNFTELLGYPDELQPKHHYEKPISCDRYCIDCETNGTLAKAGGKLTNISHGCDIFDFENILGPKAKTRDAVEYPIMFILEDPGGEYALGKEVPFSGFVKKPPVSHYYFSPRLNSWPQSIEDVLKDGNYYGSYFAYVMQSHSLSDVYITNVVKCKRVDVEKPHLVEANCVRRFLEKEMKEFSPRIVFCFGKKVFKAVGSRFPDLNCLLLYHPSFIQNFSKTKGMSRAEAISENDRRIAAKIKSLTSREAVEKA
jgi:hypothetical protein